MKASIFLFTMELYDLCFSRKNSTTPYFHLYYLFFKKSNFFEILIDKSIPI